MDANKLRKLAGIQMTESSNTGAAVNHADLAQAAHKAYIAATKQGNSLMAAHYAKQHEKHKRAAEKQKAAMKKREVGGVAETTQIQAPKSNEVLSEAISNEYLLDQMHGLGEELLKLQDDYRRVLSAREMQRSDSFLKRKVQSLARHIDEAIDDIQTIVEFLENN